MKHIVGLSLACAALISSVGSVYALTPGARSQIMGVTKKIRAGNISSEAIIDEIKALNIPPKEMNDFVVRELNNVAYDELKNRGFTISRNVIDDIKSGTLKAVTVQPKTVTSTSTLQKKTLANALSAYLDDATVLTTSSGKQAAISDPVQKKEAIEELNKVIVTIVPNLSTTPSWSTTPFFVEVAEKNLAGDPNKEEKIATVKALKAKQDDLQENMNNNLPVIIPNATPLPLPDVTGQTVEKPFADRPLAQAGQQSLKTMFEEMDAEYNKAKAEQEKLESLPSSTKLAAEAQLASKVETNIQKLEEAKKTEKSPGVLTQMYNNFVQLWKDLTYQEYVSPDDRVRLEKMAAEIKQQLEREKDKIVAMPEGEAKKQAAEKLVAKVEQAEQTAAAKKDTATVSYLQRFKNSLTSMWPFSRGPKPITVTQNIPELKIEPVTQEVTSEREKIIPAEVGVQQPQQAPSDANLKYFWDLIQACKSNEHFFNGNASTAWARIKQQGNIPINKSEDIHKLYDSIIKQANTYSKDELIGVLRGYFEINCKALDKTLKAIANIQKSTTDVFKNNINALVRNTESFLNHKNQTLLNVVNQIINIKNEIRKLGADIGLNDTTKESINKSIDTIVGKILHGTDFTSNAQAGKVVSTTKALNVMISDTTKDMREFLSAYSQLIGAPVQLNALRDLLAFACCAFDVNLYEFQQHLITAAGQRNWTQWWSQLGTEKKDFSKADNMQKNLANYTSAIDAFINTYSKNFPGGTIAEYLGSTFDVKAYIKNDALWKDISPLHKKDYKLLFQKASDELAALTKTKTAEEKIAAQPTDAAKTQEAQKLLEEASKKETAATQAGEGVFASVWKAAGNSLSYFMPGKKAEAATIQPFKTRPENLENELNNLITALNKLYNDTVEPNLTADQKKELRERGESYEKELEALQKRVQDKTSKEGKLAEQAEKMIASKWFLNIVAK